MLDDLKLKLYGKYVGKLMKDYKIPGFAVGLSQHGVTDKLKWIVGVRMFSWTINR